MSLTLSVKTGYNGVLGAPLRQRVQTLTRAARDAQKEAAALANARSRELAARRRPGAPPRENRDYASIATTLKWTPTRSGMVGLNLAELNASAPHWIIQEIGTNAHAVQRVANRPNPVGRPLAGAAYIKTVPPQTGRRIRATLVWATGPGGNWVAAGAGTNQQLYLRKMIKFPKGVDGAAYSSAFSGRSQPGIIIRREIPPKHFVQQGAVEGFRLYRGSVLSAARSQFRRVR